MRRIFERQAVALVLEEDFTVKEVTKPLDMHESTLYDIIKEYETLGLMLLLGASSIAT